MATEAGFDIPPFGTHQKMAHLAALLLASAVGARAWDVARTPPMGFKCVISAAVDSHALHTRHSHNIPYPTAQHVEPLWLLRHGPDPDGHGRSDERLGPLQGRLRVREQRRTYREASPLPGRHQLQPASCLPPPAANQLIATYRVIPNLAQDCWMNAARDANGNQVANADKFPQGFKAVADYIHSLGMKSGLYTAKGPSTCAGFAASCKHEAQDALQWASWGIARTRQPPPNHAGATLWPR